MPSEDATAADGPIEPCNRNGFEYRAEIGWGRGGPASCSEAEPSITSNDDSTLAVIRSGSEGEPSNGGGSRQCSCVATTSAASTTSPSRSPSTATKLPSTTTSTS